MPVAKYDARMIDKVVNTAGSSVSTCLDSLLVTFERRMSKKTSRLTAHVLARSMQLSVVAPKWTTEG